MRGQRGPGARRTGANWKRRVDKGEPELNSPDEGKRFPGITGEKGIKKTNRTLMVRAEERNI